METRPAWSPFSFPDSHAFPGSTSHLLPGCVGVNIQVPRCAGFQQQRPFFSSLTLRGSHRLALVDPSGSFLPRSRLRKTSPSTRTCNCCDKREERAGVNHEMARRASTQSQFTACLLMLHSPNQVTQQWAQMYEPFIGSQSEKLGKKYLLRQTPIPKLHMAKELDHVDWLRSAQATFSCHVGLRLRRVVPPTHNWESMKRMRENSD